MIKVTILFLLFLTSCTMTFTNISTNGKATDVIDENLKADADVDANVSLQSIP